jgi:hypothetical protein
VTGITLSEAWERMARALTRRFAPTSRRTRATFARKHHYRSRCLSGKSRWGLVQSAPKKYSASPLPQITLTTPAIPRP